MIRIRSQQYNLSGAICALYVLLAFCGMHLLHHHSHSSGSIQTYSLEQASRAAECCIDHAAKQALCPVCSLLSHSTLDRDPGRADLTQPQANGFAIPGRKQNLLRLALNASCSPRAPPSPTC